MKIKLCGFKNPRNIQLAIASGVDFLGFIFVKNSPRYISVESAKEIKDLILQDVKKVAVVVNADFMYLAKIIENFSPDFVQFHGDENMEFLKKFKEKYPEIGVIKAIRINEEKDLLEADKFEQIADYLMFDSKIKTKNEGEFGGTGHGFNWKILDKLNLKKPWFLSGGIKISNLDEALKTKAFALDISSGIEKIKGEKSDEMIVELMKNLKMKRLEMKDLEK